MKGYDAGEQMMANYLIILNEVERRAVLNALEKSTIYGAHAKAFGALLDKVSDAQALEEDGKEEPAEEGV